MIMRADNKRARCKSLVKRTREQEGRSQGQDAGDKGDEGNFPTGA
jgi:hypothetical protein